MKNWIKALLAFAFVANCSTGSAMGSNLGNIDVGTFGVLYTTGDGVVYWTSNYSAVSGLKWVAQSYIYGAGQSTCYVMSDGHLECTGLTGDGIPPSGTFKSVHGTLNGEWVAIRSDDTPWCFGMYGNNSGYACTGIGTWNVAKIDHAYGEWGNAWSPEMFGCLVGTDGYLTAYDYSGTPVIANWPGYVDCQVMKSQSYNHHFMMALKTDGTIVFHGKQYNGAELWGDLSGNFPGTYKQISGGWTDYGGAYYQVGTFCAVRSDDKPVCHTVGNSAVEDWWVANTPDVAVRDVAVGKDIACASRLSDDKVICWGVSASQYVFNPDHPYLADFGWPSNSCAVPVPDFANVGDLNYSPTSPDQSWVYSSGAVASCSYSCVGGYSGSWCLTAPPSCTDGILNQDETDIDTGGVCGYDYEPTVPVPEPSVNGVCGSASKNYSYTGASYVGTFCTAGSLSGSTPDFPSPGSYSNWHCNGTNIGTDASCYAYRSIQPNSCASPVPSFSNVGNLRYDPTSPYQSWVYSSGSVASCSYSCVGGYSGSDCSVVPTVPGSGTSDTGTSGGLFDGIFKPISDLAGTISEFFNWVKTLFEIVDLPGNTGISLGESGEKFGGTFVMGNQIVALGSERVSTKMTINGTTCPKDMVMPDDSNVSGTGVLTVHTRKAYLYNGKWNCYTFAVNDHVYDLSKMVVDGKFTYMKDAFGNEISVSNGFKIRTDFRNDVTVNIGWDLKVFGYSVIQTPLSKVVGVTLDVTLYVANFLLSLGSNFLDLFAMGTVNYGGESYGSFYYPASSYPDDGFQRIAFAGSTWSYYSEPKTGDNWVIDAFIIALTGWWVTRKWWKKW